MSGQDNFDQLMNSWLADGPHRLPEAAIDRIVGEIERSNERRPSRLPRRETMNRFVVAAGSLAAVALLAVIGIGLATGGGVFGPGATPSPTPSPTINPLLYVSDRHAYSLVLPNEQWQIEEVAGTWSTGSIFKEPPAAGSDVVVDPDAPEVVRFLNSQEVTEGTTFDQWLQGYDNLHRAYFLNCTQVATEDHVVGGETGLLTTWNCSPGTDDQAVDSAQLQVLHGDRAYVFRVLGDSSTIDERALLIDWLSSLEFTDPPASN